MTTIDAILPILAIPDTISDESLPASRGADYELAQQAAAGDRAAFEEIYWRYQQRVFGICYRMTKSVPESEDLTQQVFIQLFRKIGSFRGNSAFATWLHRLTVNLVLMYFRKNKTVLEQTTDDGVMPEPFQTDAKPRGENQIINRIVLDEAIKRLPKGYRKMLILHDICGLEHEEIGKLLDCATGTSKSQLFKARRKLRQLLSGDAEKKNRENAPNK